MIFVHCLSQEMDMHFNGHQAKETEQVHFWTKQAKQVKCLDEYQNMQKDFNLCC